MRTSTHLLASKIGSALAVAALSLTALAASSSYKSAEAAVVAPDLNSYCRRAYRGGRASFSYKLNSWICTVGSHGGWGLTHYRVNMASACQMTRGTTQYRYYGDRRVVRCITRNIRPPKTTPNWTRAAVRRQPTAPDLNRYCRTKFRGGQANFSYPLNGWLCTVRSHGGRGLTHYRVNMAEACQMTRGTYKFRYYGDRRNVKCV